MIEFTGAKFAERRLIRRVEKAVYAVLMQQDIFSVDLAVTDGETVRQFNRETRGVDSETDVLSFPYFEGLKLPVTTADFSEYPLRARICRRKSTVIPTRESWASSPVTGCCICSASTT